LQSDHDPDGIRSTGAPAPMNRTVNPAMDRRMKRIAIAFAITLLAAFAIVETIKLISSHQLANATETLTVALPVVDVIAVRTPAAAESISLRGETAAWDESIIYARVSGYVAKWNVDIGDRVDKDQVLATIDTPELDAEYGAAQAKLASSVAEAKVREAEADFAETTYARWRDSPKGVVSEQEREDKKAGNATAIARLAASRAQVNQDQANVDRLAAFQKFKRVTAPYAGTIVERRIDIGNLVTAGSSASTTPLYRMVSDDPIRVFVDVPQSASTDLMKAGVPASVVTNDVPSRRFEGRIARTSAAVNPHSRTFKVEVDIPNPRHALVTGLYVQVQFELGSNGMLQVPAAALLFRTRGPQVAVVGPDNTVKFHNVTIARDDGNLVELGSGVVAGDRVVLNVSSQIIDGEKVQISGSADGAAAGAPKR
jgi:RND family efflux transporter MFP subunit